VLAGTGVRAGEGGGDKVEAEEAGQGRQRSLLLLTVLVGALCVLAVEVGNVRQREADLEYRDPFLLTVLACAWFVFVYASKPYGCVLEMQVNDMPRVPGRLLQP
jgi:hypothetical protein